MFIFHPSALFLLPLEVFYDRQGKLSQNLVSIIFLLVLASSLHHRGDRHPRPLWRNS